MSLPFEPGDIVVGVRAEGDVYAIGLFVCEVMRERKGKDPQQMAKMLFTNHGVSYYDMDWLCARIITEHYRVIK